MVIFDLGDTLVEEEQTAHASFSEVARLLPRRPQGGYQAFRVCEWKSMMARRSPMRPMTRSVSVAGSVIAR